MDQVVPSGKYVDANGNVLFTAGEAGPEEITIRPLKQGAAARAKVGSKVARQYRTGGDVKVGGRRKSTPAPMMRAPMMQAPAQPPADQAPVQPPPNVPFAQQAPLNRLMQMAPSGYKTGGDIRVAGPRSKAAPKRYATGGDLTVNGASSDDPNVTQNYHFDPASNSLVENASQGTTSAPSADPSGTDQGTFGPGYNTTGYAATPLGPGSATYGQGGTQQYEANANVLNSTAADIAANKGVVGATNADIAANRNVLPYETTQLSDQRSATAANSAYLTTQQQNNAASRSEELAQEAAARNVPDITATALAQRVNENQDQLFGAYGLSKPIEVTLPAGTQNVAAPGVRTAPQTQQQLLAGLAKEQSAQRGFNVEDSRIAAGQANDTATLAGYDVRQAQIGAEGSALDLRSASNAAKESGLDLQTTQLAAKQTEQPPEPGDVLDSFSGQWVTQSQEREIQRQQRVNYDPVNGQYTTNEELKATTDAAGNRLRTSDNTWVAKNGNELIDGTWTDPKTGDGTVATRNYFDPQQNAWIDPTSGNKFVVTNSHTGAGYWQNPQGLVLGPDGVWTNQVTHQRYIVQNGALVPENKAGGNPFISGGGAAPVPGGVVPP